MRVGSGIGVFDSGIGGLSVLDALRHEMPLEDFIYYADSAHAPYGERDEAHVLERSAAVAQELLARFAIKALVVACNTATAAAIRVLRETYPSLPLIGIEPALKPAVSASRTRRIAVLATCGTVNSRKFEALLASLSGQAQFSVVACDGLASAIERDDAPEIAALCARYIGQAGNFGLDDGQIDTLVLGCTHYPFVADELRRHTGPGVRFLETGAPVARQTRRMLCAAGLLADATSPGTLVLACSGDPKPLQAAAARWLRPMSEATA